MKRILLCLTLSLSCSLAQKIPEVPLSRDHPIVVGIGTEHATILEFPSTITGLLGYGLSDGTEPGDYHYAHPKESHLLSLRNVRPGKEANVSVLLGRELVSLRLVPNKAAPQTIRFLDADASRGPKARRISAVGVKEKRLDYASDKLFNLLKLARNERVFRAYRPHLYKDAESRQAELIYDDENTATVIRQLHRFPKEDVLVLIGDIENRLDYPIQIDPASFEVRVSKRVYPVALVDAPEVVPAGASAPVHLIVKGDSEGNRANLSIKNDFRIILSDYCRYEEPDPQLTGYIDASLFGEVGPEQPHTVVLKEGGQK